MKNQKTIKILSVIFSSIILTTTFIITGCRKSDSAYKIGAILPLTGDKAAYGTKSQRGIELALEDIKKEMPDLKIEVLYEDSKFDIKQAVSAYQKLRSINKIKAVITLSSEVSLAIAPLANQDRVLQMAIVCSTPDYTSVGDYTFRTTPRAEVEDKELAKAIIPKYKKIGLMYNNNERGIGHRNAIKAEIIKLGGEIVIEEAIPVVATSYRNNLLRIKNKNPDAVYLLTEAKNIGIILKQAKELEMNMQFFGTRSTESKEVISIAGKAADGIIYTFAFDPTSSESLVKNVVERYKTKYSETPDYIVAEAYDGIMLLAKCYNKFGPNPEKIKNELFATKDYKGLSGILSFDENGDVYYPYHLKTIKNGQFVLLEK